MKMLFNPCMHYDAGYRTSGGFTTEEKAELKKAIGDLQSALEEKQQTWQDQKETEFAKNQSAIDEFLIKAQAGINAGGSVNPSFGDVFRKSIADQFESKRSEFEYFQKSKDAKLTIELKTVGDMGMANLTGNGQSVYNPKLGLIPAQKINFRDLIPTVPSDTGIYVSYKETGSEGSFEEQAEGEEKSQIDYDLTEIKNVSSYVAGFARFSKQMMRHLPWLQNTLPRLLLRDFYKKENRMFYDKIATAYASGGVAVVTTETDDDLQLLDALMSRLDRDFNNSFVLMRFTAVGRILKKLRENGNYYGAGSFLESPNGQLTIAGTPVLGVTFVPSYDKALIIDSDYLERVETESLRVEFSYEDDKNFTKNLVTARVECFEDLNVLRADAHTILDFGNSSSS